MALERERDRFSRNPLQTYQYTKAKMQEVTGEAVDTSLVFFRTQTPIAKNRLMLHHGFSPQQHVFGRSPRLPGDLLDEQSCRVSEALGGVFDGFNRSQEIRCAARAAMLSSEAVGRLADEPVTIEAAGDRAEQSVSAAVALRAALRLPG